MQTTNTNTPYPTPMASASPIQEGKAESRIAILSVIVDDLSSAAAVNGYLSEFGAYIVGRMGIPYREKGVSVLSVVLDAPSTVTNALTGKLGKLHGVTAKALFSKF